jgi:Tfp pilus assembly protein PilP
MQHMTHSAKWVVLLALAACCVPGAVAWQAQTALQAQKVVKQSLGDKPKPASQPESMANTTNAPAKEAAPAHVRDPFAALVRTGDAGDHLNLPPGIAGLQVATLRLQGLVKGPEGMVAIVSNPQDRVYFLHEGDHIYDGLVEKIEMDKITFQQENKDAFGRPVQREIIKRLYPIAGEEQ